MRNAIDCCVQKSYIYKEFLPVLCIDDAVIYENATLFLNKFCPVTDPPGITTLNMKSVPFSPEEGKFS
jgi:hypothetical protein